MNTELTQKIFDDFPRLFKGKDYGMQVNLMCFGFEVDDGWFNIIYELCAGIEAEFKKLSEAQQAEALKEDHYIAAQVKEKFGGLRFYMEGETKEMSDLISKAEEASFKTCEVCGEPGEPKRGGWIKTLCDEHNENQL